MKQIDRELKEFQRQKALYEKVWNCLPLKLHRNYFKFQKRKGDIPMNKELQEIQKLIDSDTSHDNHYLLHNNKVRLLIFTIETQANELEQARIIHKSDMRLLQEAADENEQLHKELEWLKEILQKPAITEDDLDLEHRKVEQLRNQLREAVEEKKPKRCDLCPDDEETCYCYDDKPVKEDSP